MAVGKNETILDLLLGYYTGANITALTDVYIQLHTGDPGAAGTSNVATSDTRKEVTFGSPSTSGTNRRIANSVLIRWEGNEIEASESVSHFSLWSAATDGTFIESGELDTPKSLVQGDPAEIAIGALTLDLGPVAS